jgi:nucleoside-diphosphate-sugar epimerase
LTPGNSEWASSSLLDTNIRGTWALLEACRRSPAVQQIVTASSDKAYGDQYLDAGKARKVLGWSPAFSFEAGLRTTIDWYTRYIAALGGTPEPEARRG